MAKSQRTISGQSLKAAYRKRRTPGFDFFISLFFVLLIALMFADPLINKLLELIPITVKITIGDLQLALGLFEYHAILYFVLGLLLVILLSCKRRGWCWIPYLLGVGYFVLVFLTDKQIFTILESLQKWFPYILYALYYGSYFFLGVLYLVYLGGKVRKYQHIYILETVQSYRLSSDKAAVKRLKKACRRAARKRDARQFIRITSAEYAPYLTTVED